MNKYRKQQGLTRRKFLLGSAIGASLITQPLSVLAQSRKVESVGLQLYTLRNAMAQDLEATLAQVAELGYREMEFAGYFGRSAQELRQILDANGLSSPAAHIQLSAVRQNLDAEIEFAATLGQRYIVVPYLQPSERTWEHYEALVETLNRAGEACKAAGLRMGYHNHDFEFAEINGRIPYDYILQQTDPDLVDMELDLFWIAHAGRDPVQYFESHPGRFKMLHVKDRDENGNMVAVGQGVIPFAEIFAHRDQAGFDHYFVEHDNPGDNALASVAYSFNTIRNLNF